MISERLGKLSTREKIGLGLAVFCVFALLVDQFILQYVSNRLAELDLVIEKEKGTLDCIRTTLLSETAVRKDYESVKGLIPFASKPAEDVDRMKGELDEISRGSDVDLQSYQDKEPRLTSAYVEYSVRIAQFEAEIKNLLIFLHELHMSPGMFRVESLAMTPAKKEQGGTRIVKGSMIISKIMLVRPGDGESASSVPPSGQTNPDNEQR